MSFVGFLFGHAEPDVGIPFGALAVSLPKTWAHGTVVSLEFVIPLDITLKYHCF